MTDTPKRHIPPPTAQLAPIFFQEPTPWMVDAACKDWPTNWWFPQRGADTERAKIICFTCPVRLECLNYALGLPNTVGIWGGTSGRERREIGRPTSEKPIRHGTTTGYHQELRRNLEPCAACRRANTEASKQRQLRRQELELERRRGEVDAVNGGESQSRNVHFDQQQETPATLATPRGQAKHTGGA